MQNPTMDRLAEDLSRYGIRAPVEIIHNPSYAQLFEEETREGLLGYEKGVLTETGAVNVMTGVYTGRSPKDKYFVVDDVSRYSVWWDSRAYTNDNHPLTRDNWT